MKRQLFIPINLQYFSADIGSEGQDATPAENQDQTSPSDQENSEVGKKYSRDDVAKMVSAETKKAVAAAEEKWKTEKIEADKLAEMNDKDKADYERQKLEDKIAEYERKENLAKMSEQASEMLVDKGVTATKEVLSLVVSEDAETTSNNVKTYLTAIEAEREAIRADYEKRLGGKVPLDGNGTPTLSRGAQMAQAANNQIKKPENDPWATN
ncbi:DUF4355 domain-containing protein [Enterococcus sp. BWR-S5]|uniref:DUF4355 domain-containing protein n=1 Tax=Enterococcus sp. BWR-S5 TaxID=2787714 RepID=UPI001920622B|nr:DUF4355 domain-containing protein [Enterococcus sp. BWR-S5]MBL1225375.1 DUF4355 domain-containing protein [Enterococcus sp. BWR-S5]